MNYNEVKTNLEILMDNEGSTVGLDMIHAICLEKAQHIRETYQDKALARYWEKFAKRLENINQ